MSHGTTHQRAISTVIETTSDGAELTDWLDEALNERYEDGKFEDGLRVDVTVQFREVAE